jgi:flagellar protein FlgJ
MSDQISRPTQLLQTLNAHHQIKRAQDFQKSMLRSSSDRLDAKLRTACQEMESIFLSHLLKEMRASINRSGFISGGTAEDIFTSMLDSALAKNISARGGIGLSELLLDQLGSGSDKDDGRKP